MLLLTFQVPDRIDNTELLIPESVELRQGLQEGFDYDILPSEVWNFLVSW